MPSTWEGSAPPEGDVLKIPWGNGYEHFRPTGERQHAGGTRVDIYHWIMRTKIAE
ncbi:DUF5988 family protein [Streptomyces sp. NPDC048419]|uniref:DUF5988 family protein n=1 Tax=Streptomyces sp. NPDC048419 TaxID=3365547 RepID=UPI003712D6AE